MPNNPLTPQEILTYLQASAQQGYNAAQLPPKYVFATDPVNFAAPAFRLFDAAFISTGIIDPNRLGTGATGAGNLYLADDGTWKAVSGGGGGGDMYKATYDVDNSGVVDNAESISIIGRNSTGSTLYKGTIVYIFGSTGNRPNFVKAQANVEATSAGTFGVVRADILNNSDGYVTTIGYLDNLDTRLTATNPFTDVTLADGDTVYLHPTIAGYITNVKPSAPNHIVYVGKVTRTSPTNGTIIYRIQNGYELDEIHDVAISSKANNDLLVYESATNLWKNKTFSAIFGGTPLVSVPTLAQVTTAGNTTTNSITVGGLNLGTNIGVTSSSAFGLNYIEFNALTATQGISALFKPATGSTGYAYDFEFRKDTTTYAGLLIIGGNASAGGGTANKNIFAISNEGGRSDWMAFRVAATNSSWFSQTDLLSLTHTQNVLIGTTTDAGYKLDVNGTGRYQGALTVYDNFNILRSTFLTDVFNIYSSTNSGITTPGRGQYILTHGGLEIYRAYSTRIVIPNIPLQIGTNSTELAMLQVTGSRTAATAVARGVYFNNTLVAAANDDVLVGLDINPIFTSGAFTGLGKIAARIQSGALLVGTTLLNTDVISFPVQVNGSSQNIGAVWRNALSTGYTSFRFYNDQNLNTRAMEMGYAGSAYPSAIVTGGVTGESAYLTTTGAYPVQLGTNNTARFIIFSGGNVGINTNTDAGYKLDVNGTVRFGDLASTYYVTLANGGADGAIFRVGGSTYGYAEIKSTAITLNGAHSISGTGGTAQFTLTSQVAPPAAQSNAAIKFVADNPGSGGGTWAAYTTALAFNFLKKETGGTYTSILAMNGRTNFVGIGTITPSAPLQVATSVTASSALAQGVYFNNTLVAAANNDVLVGLDINPTFTNGAFTGVTNFGIRVQSGKTVFGAALQGQPSDHYFGSIGANPTLVVRNLSATSGGSDIQQWWADNNKQAYLNSSGDFYPSRVRVTSVGPSYPGISFSSDSTAGIGYTTGVTIITNNTERLRVFNTTGNVGINTTTDAGYKLDVNGTGRYVGSLNIWRNTTTNGFILSSGSNDTLQWNNGTWDIQYNSGTPVTILRLSNGVGGVSYLTSKININAPNVISNLGYSLGVYGNLRVSGSLTASSGSATGVYYDNTLVAAANNDILVGLDINPTFTNGAFTGVQNYAVRIASTTSIVRIDSSVVGSFHGIEFSNSGNIDTEIKQRPSTGEFRISNGRFAGWGGFITLYTDTAERMRIGNNGNVLIGTTTDAGYKLNVNGNIGLSGNLVPTSGTSTVGTFANRFTDFWGSGLIVGTTFYGDNYQTASGTMYFKDGGGAEKMRMDSSGSFMINATSRTYGASYGYMLGVKGTTSQSFIAIARSGQNLDSQGFLIGLDAGQGYLFMNDNIPITFYTNGSQKMVLHADGNLSIGNSSNAGFKLDVNGTTKSNKFLAIDTSNNSVFRIGASTSSEGGLYLRSGAASDAEIAGGAYFVSGYAYAAATGSSAINFYAGHTYFMNNTGLTVGNVFTPTVRMFIKNDGNIGIGNTSPTAKLHVSGDIKATLSSATTSDVVYYNSSTGLMTYGAAPSGGGGGTLDSVTTSGNTTTNSISVGGLTVSNSAVPIASFDSSNGGGTYLAIKYGGALKAAWGISGNIIGGLSINDVGFWSSNAMAWEAGGSQRMFLTASGNFLINTISDNGNRLQVNGTIDGQAFAVAGTNGWTGTIIIATNPPGQQNIHVSGGIITGFD